MWSRLTWLITCTPEPSHQELHCSLLLYVLHCSLLMVVCDHHCLWYYCSVMTIVSDLIVLLLCTLSQVAALLYISCTYILELGLKPDLVCNLLHSLSLLLEPTFPFYPSLKLSSNPWRYFPFLFIFTQTLVLATFLPLSHSKVASVIKGIMTLVTSVAAATAPSWFQVIAEIDFSRNLTKSRESKLWLFWAARSTMSRSSWYFTSCFNFF